jgi:glucoamylase
MLPEQLWDADDLPDGRMKRGAPTGSAMPLCWAHAEYVSLVRSAHDGVCFDRVEPAYQRYVVKPVAGRHEIWTFCHPTSRLPAGQIVRLIVAADATVSWSSDGWVSTHQTAAVAVGTLNLWFVDLPTEAAPPGATIEFTFFWKEAQRWEGNNFTITVCPPR